MILRIIGILLSFGLTGCGNQYIPLPKVEDSDPVAQLNPDRWQATVNDLMAPPGDGSPRRVPTAVEIKGSSL